MNTEVQTFDNFAGQIGRAMESLARSIAEAGRLVVEVVEAFPDAIPRLQQRFPQVPPRMWNILEKVGRGTIDERIALGCPYAFKLQRLPLSEQRRALDEPLDLALPGGDSCKVRLQDATPDQARQLIGDTGVRTLEQQAQWMRSQRIVVEPKAQRAALTYEPRSRKGEVVFTSRGPGELVLTKSDLLDLLRRLG